MTNNRIEKVLAEFDKRFFGEPTPKSWDRFQRQDPNVIKAFLKTTLEQFEKEIRGEVIDNLKVETEKLYTEYEEHKPEGLQNAHERSYNNGLYQGRLTAMENVCQRVFKTDGDNLLT